VLAVEIIVAVVAVGAAVIATWQAKSARREAVAAERSAEAAEDQAKISQAALDLERARDEAAETRRRHVEVVVRQETRVPATGGAGSLVVVNQGGARANDVWITITALNGQTPVQPFQRHASNTDERAELLPGEEWLIPLRNYPDPQAIFPIDIEVGWIEDDGNTRVHEVLVRKPGPPEVSGAVS
jgi:hypothetical protein